MKKIILYTLSLLVIFYPVLYAQSGSRKIFYRENGPILRKIIIEQATQKIDRNFTKGFFSQYRIGLMGIGVKVGYMGVERAVGSTLGFGCLFNFSIINNILLGTDILYWFYSYKSDDQADRKSDEKVSNMSISAVMKYFFSSEFRQLRPFAGFGLGMILSHVPASHTDARTGTQDKVYEHHLDILVVGGVKYALSHKIAIFGEYRYNIAGYADYWGIYAGMVYNIK